MSAIGGLGSGHRDTLAPRPCSGRARARDILLNWPLVAGFLIVLILLAAVLWGPLLAPQNPYLAGQRAARIENGRVVAPPFPPRPGLPLGSDQWGRDILSLLLYGARNTLVACLFIAAARVILGCVLGGTAAWHEGRTLDRLIMGAIELSTSLPTLLAGVILILALDIRRGITVFLIALCLVGWGEIAQHVRSEFMAVRRKPFIEGARVIGLDGPAIAIRHILPNVLPAICVLAFLEMGAVLMILGELGFVGVFIGGGTAIEGLDGLRLTIPNVPEWGAMMADSRAWAHSQPWMVFYPALAFFVAVLGFNLLGEGLRRLIQRGGVNTAFVFSRKMLVALTVLVLATSYIVTHIGPAPSYAQLAQGFDLGQAMTHLQKLAGAEMAGRGLETAGAEAAGFLLQGSGLTLDDLTIQYTPLPLASRAELTVTLREAEQGTARNVLGLLPGRSRTQAGEIVILGAHYDHLGHDPGGALFPGANDDASGVGVLLELARLAKAGGWQPRRSILLAAWGAEEEGLVGSRYYVDHPWAPLTRTMMIQLDMVGQGRGYYLELHGDAQQAGEPLAALALGAEQVDVRASTMEASRNSDQAPFQDRQVPAALLTWRGGENAHLPTDTADQLDPQKLAAAGRAAAAAMRALGDGY